MARAEQRFARSVVLALAVAAIVLALSAPADGTRHRHCKRHRGGCQCPTTGQLAPNTSSRERTTWTPLGTPPLSDAQAAAMVRHRPEQRPQNTPYNEFVPSPSEIAAFRSARNYDGQRILRSNRLNAYVDGLDCMSNPSTDDLIQWASLKWGIPTDWLRAQYAKESHWYQLSGLNKGLGDRAAVPPSWYRQYPLVAQIAGTRESEVYESLGITQVKWKPDNSQYPGTEPLRWKSTAFNVDFQAAQVRYFYDGYCRWCTGGYSAGQEWNSIGAWYQPRPWANGSAVSYIASVQAILAAKPWLSPGF
jgi:hypothetical protein